MKRRTKDLLVDTHLCQPPRHDDAGPPTHEAEFKGRKVRVTVPPREDRDLGDALKDNLSPEAVAAIATIILSRINGGDTPTRVRRVNKELNWFGQELVDLVGGPEECHRLTEEIGL
jgi:hypothetical protein